MSPLCCARIDSSRAAKPTLAGRPHERDAGGMKDETLAREADVARRLGGGEVVRDRGPGRLAPRKVTVRKRRCRRGRRAARSRARGAAAVPFRAACSARWSWLRQACAGAGMAAISASTRSAESPCGGALPGPSGGGSVRRSRPRSSARALAGPNGLGTATTGRRRSTAERMPPRRRARTTAADATGCASTAANSLAMSSCAGGAPTGAMSVGRRLSAVVRPSCGIDGVTPRSSSISRRASSRPSCPASASRGAGGLRVCGARLVRVRFSCPSSCGRQLCARGRPRGSVRSSARRARTTARRRRAPDTRRRRRREPPATAAISWPAPGIHDARPCACAICAWPPCSKARSACARSPEPLARETEVAPRARVGRVEREQVLEIAARELRLPGLQVTEREVQEERGVVRVSTPELLVDLDRARVEAEAEVDDGEEVLALRVARLEMERALELLLRLVDAVVLEELASAIEVKEEVLVRRVARACRSRV